MAASLSMSIVVEPLAESGQYRKAWVGRDILLRWRVRRIERNRGAANYGIGGGVDPSSMIVAFVGEGVGAANRHDIRSNSTCK